MLSIFDRVLDQIEENRHKKDNCIPFSEKLPRFSRFVSGIEKKKYYLISGASGSGKSQFVDEFFVFNPLEFVLENETNVKVKILYYSFELDADTKVKQWIRRRLYNKYGLIVDAQTIDSVGYYRPSDAVMMAIKETREFFEKAGEHIKMIDTPKTAKEILAEIHEFAKTNGKIHETNGEFDYYEPSEKDQYVIVIVDHYSLLKVPNNNIKASIEELSQGFVDIRNKYGYTLVPLQQQSAESENIEHFKLSKLEPSKQGLAESKLTYNDCDLALGLFCPYKHELKSYRSYNIGELGDNFRNLSVFKHRYGVPHLNTGLYFDGCVGYFKELPKGKEMTSIQYDLAKQGRPVW